MGKSTEKASTDESPPPKTTKPSILVREAIASSQFDTFQGNNTQNGTYIVSTDVNGSPYNPCTKINNYIGRYASTTHSIFFVTWNVFPPSSVLSLS